MLLYKMIKQENVWRSKIFKPNSKLNELENRYKVVVWKNGIQYSVKFADTKKQILEKRRRITK